MKTVADLEKMKDAELTAFVEEKRREVQQHRFGMGGRNVMAARTAKKEIARALTVLGTRTQSVS